MSIIIPIFSSLLLVQHIHSLAVLVRESKHSGNEIEYKNALRKILENISNAKFYLTNGDRRSISPIELAKARNVFEVLSKTMGAGRLKKVLRDANNPPEVEGSNLEQAAQVENELQDAFVQKPSPLMDKAYLQKKGRNDYLVMRDSIADPFVTIIPNNIYYDIEKKCVNWLDDCSLQGIRARLLERIRSPFR